MAHTANLIRASNGNPPAAPAVRNRQRPGPRRLGQQNNLEPVPPPGYINYGIRENVDVLASKTDGALAGEHRKLDVDTLVTVRKVEKQLRKGRRRLDRVYSVYFDKDSHGFQWLRQGWVAEKVVPPNRNPYWLYYNPQGKQHRTRKQVLKIYIEQE